MEQNLAETCPEDAPPGQLTVLVVDDDVAIREMLALVLEMEGYRALQAADGRAALAVFEEEQVHLVTLDVMMPGLDGWQVADALRANPKTRFIPRIMISGLPIDHMMRACAARQAAAIFTKPFDVEKVVALIGRLLDPVDAVPAPRVSR